MNIGFRKGVRLLGRGLRKGDAGAATVGAVLVAMAIVRWTSTPERELIRTEKVKRGRTLRIEVSGPQMR